MAVRLTSRTKTLLVVGLACVVVAAGVTVFVATSSEQSSAKGPSPADAANLDWLSHILASDTTQAQSAALAEELRPAYLRQAHKLIPSGQHIHILMDTFKAGGPVGATVEADVTGQGRLLLLLVREQSRWLVYDTEPLTQATRLARQVADARPEHAKADLLLSQAQSGCAPGIGTRTPVLLVHGFTSSPQMWSRGNPSMEQVLKKIPQLYVAQPFDYSSVNTQWVDNSSIGPALANDIVCLADASRTAHGPGRVIVVAHSLGGLATRYAANNASNSKQVRSDLGLVVTIGTPSLGSWLSTSDTFHHGWLRLLVALCDVDNIYVALRASGLCSLIAAGYTPAAAAMTPGSAELAALGAWPSSIPVRTIAGDIQIVSFTVFHVRLDLAANSDFAVGVPSALHGSTGPAEGGGSVTISCSAFNFPHIMPACWHGAEATDPEIQQQVVAAITTYLTATATAPVLTIPPLNTVPSSYAHGVEYTIDPSDKANPQDSSEVIGFNWWPGLGPNGSLGVVHTVAVGAGGVVYEKTWNFYGKLANYYQISCSGADELFKQNYQAGGHRLGWTNIGPMPSVCPNATPWRVVLSSVQANRWTYNVVK